MATLKYEKLVEEDLNVGTDQTWVHAPGGGELRSTQIGVHTFARGQKKYESAWTPGAIAAGAYATTITTVPNAAVGDFVMASHTSVLTSRLVISAHVSATNTVKVEIYNPTASAVTLAAGTLAVIVFPIGSGISEEVVIPQWNVTVAVTLDGGDLSLQDGNYTWTLELWHHKADVAGALGAAPAEPDFELTATKNIQGGDDDIQTFFNVNQGVYSALATTTSVAPFNTVEANRYDSPSVLVDENTQLATLAFTTPGGGGE